MIMERGKIESFEDLLVWQKGIASKYNSIRASLLEISKYISNQIRSLRVANER